MNKKQIIACIVLAFTAGLFAGALGNAFLIKKILHNQGFRSKSLQTMFFKKLDRELNLNTDQESKAKIIAAKIDAKMLTIRKKVCPEKMQVMNEGFEELEKILNKKQKEKLQLIKQKTKTKIGKCE